jgi:hypothetical protein
LLDTRTLLFEAGALAGGLAFAAPVKEEVPNGDRDKDCDKDPEHASLRLSSVERSAA